MFGYNVEKKKVKESMQQLYRDFALQYSEIQKSELSESEKQIRINYLTENTKYADQVLMNTRSLSEISSEDKEILGIKEKEDNGKNSFSDDCRRLKNTYISYAEKNGFEITNPDVLETIEIDMAKVQGLAR